MNFIKNLDKEMLKKLGIIIGAIVVLFILLMIFFIIKNNRLTYSQIESKMINAAKAYYKQNPDQLPQVNNGVVSISTDKLVENKYLKRLDKLAKKDNCSGQVTVTKNDEYLFYSANLSCGDNYKTKKLKDVILSDVVTTKDGLYQFGDSYIFRGENVNNYVSFADKMWRIIRINNDGTIRMIETTRRDSIDWDNRYNSDKKYTSGINDYNVSRIKEKIDELYDEFSDNNKAYMVKQNLCIGKRKVDETNNDGSVECSATLPDQSLGLIQVNEYALASLSEYCKKPSDMECSNYNYLTLISPMWTLTADADTSYKAYKISGSASLSDASNYLPLKVVIHINSQVNYISGDGTEDKPYIFN